MQERDALAHAGQPKAVRGNGRIEAFSVVADDGPDRRPSFGDIDLNVSGIRVTNRVGQCFLHDPIERGLELPRVAFRSEADVSDDGEPRDRSQEVRRGGSSRNRSHRGDP